MTLKILPQDVIERLAAGEIMHSSRQALKELLENAIDAGASQIRICSTNQSISITDNGSGIDPRDFPLLATRFATSKLQDFDALLDVQTFGFRGEALCSLSYVSELVVESLHRRTNVVTHGAFKDGQAIEIKNIDPQSASESDSGWTKVLVRFTDMKADQKELLQLIKCFGVLNYKITLDYEGPESKLSIPAHETVEDRIKFLFNAQQIARTEEREEQNKYAIQLYVIPGKSESMCFINGRYVTKQPFTRTVLSQCAATSTVVIIIQVNDTQLVDFNCHPQKLQVLLRNQVELLEVIQRVFQRAKQNISWMQTEQKKIPSASSPIVGLSSQETDVVTQRQSPINKLRPQLFHTQITFQQKTSQSPATDWISNYYELQIQQKALTKAQIQSFQAELREQFAAEQESRPAPAYSYTEVIGASATHLFTQTAGQLSQFDLKLTLKECLLMPCVQLFTQQHTWVTSPLVLVEGGQEVAPELAVFGITEKTTFNPLAFLDVVPELGVIVPHFEESAGWLARLRSHIGAFVDEAFKQNMTFPKERLQQLISQGLPAAANVLDHATILKLFDRV